MPPSPIYPLTFDPIFKDYVWGGRNLASRLGRELPKGTVAESWEIAAHPDGVSVVNNGPLAGLSLPDVQSKLGEALLGRRNARMLAMGRFPLLIKLLDANRWLSVQVHPDDFYGLANENDLGKTEMWVVLHAGPGAELIYGFKPGVKASAFEAAIQFGEVEKWLHRVAVSAGDVIFVPAGSIHALGPGIIVAEIQQNSNTTYRIYDWGRPRPIHVAQALDVLDFGLVRPEPLQPTLLAESEGMRVEGIGHCPYFATERICMARDASYAGVCNGETFEIWAVLQGRVDLTWADDTRSLAGVEWVLLPAALGEYRITATEPCTLLRVYTPEDSSA